MLGIGGTALLAGSGSAAAVDGRGEDFGPQRLYSSLLHSPEDLRHDVPPAGFEKWGEITLQLNRMPRGSYVAYALSVHETDELEAASLRVSVDSEPAVDLLENGSIERVGNSFRVIGAFTPEDTVPVEGAGTFDGLLEEMSGDNQASVTARVPGRLYGTINSLPAGFPSFRDNELIDTV